MRNSLNYLVKVLFWTVLLLLVYLIWTKSYDVYNLMIMGVSALITSMIFQSKLPVPSFALKRVFYSLIYIPYLFKEIVKANFDVALRVIKPVIPLEPGIVAVQTKLKSKIGRMILANSITLTPGTLTVDIKGDTLHIHCIDLSEIDESNASEKIVSGFERYLEVIFG